MVIVTLKDGTTYNMNTDDEYKAKSAVDYKLRQRLDFRQIASSQLIKGVICDPNSKYSNNCDWDSKELVCSSGWSYKWN